MWQKNKNSHSYVKRSQSSFDKEIWLFLWHITIKIIIGIVTYNIIPNLSRTVRALINFYEIHTTYKIITLLIITNITWGGLRYIFLCEDAFLYNSTYQINLISLTSLGWESKSLRFPRSLLWDLKVALRTKRVNLEFDFGKLSKMWKYLNVIKKNHRPLWRNILFLLNNWINDEIYHNKWQEIILIKYKILDS